ncbi:TIGR02221 family CRISPR-associated protein [Campylobacter geochelonis]|uniref:CRISPR-associated protein, TM1812 family n=1 Tax=Campylobacter geochelonis TaxID=1780362 RepID=A0A128ECX2_9BACT|nr:TIGR02221 family CRISPR-associated protein [Campylobacter geochelonis]QKF72052.1 CRISPR/Cas system-associated protein Csx1 (DxTHG domain), type III-U [Campylobacter geochelonis]CZE46830.1 CRISPR-associated protein%2C TM1812 family [Campylobacter geochelonis]
MAKVLISSIGTGDKNKGYNKTNYKIDGKLYENEIFIANVLSRHLSIDKLFLIGTEKSIWDAVYSKFGGDEKTEFKIYEQQEKGNLQSIINLIESQIDKTLKTKGSRCFIIKYGVDEIELWDNFSKFLEIASGLEEKDEIYLDITHSFRSLSLMSFVMSEFTSNTRENPLNIKGIYYGMLELSRENDGTTPIINLSMFFELLEWGKAIRSLKIYGNSKDLLRLINKTEDKKDIKNAFNDFSNALNMSDMLALQKAVRNLYTKIKFFTESENEIYKIIGKELLSFINRLNVEEFHIFQYELAKWYQENQNYPLSYVVLVEAVVSAIAKRDGLDSNKKKDNIFIKEIAQNEYKYFECIREIRNGIAHALENNKEIIENEDAIKNLPKYIKDLSYLFE